MLVGCKGLAAEKSTAALREYLVPERRSRRSLVHEDTARSRGHPFSRPRGPVQRPQSLSGTRDAQPRSSVFRQLEVPEVNPDGTISAQRAAKPSSVRKLREGSHRTAHQQLCMHVRNLRFAHPLPSKPGDVDDHQPDTEGNPAIHLTERPETCSEGVGDVPRRLGACHRTLTVSLQLPDDHDHAATTRRTAIRRFACTPCGFIRDCREVHA